MFRPAILYVDDEQANLDTFKRIFGQDYLVKVCLSGAEALQLIEKEDFPLVIADQKMPEMSGIELCEKIMAVKPEIIRMILTAYTDSAILLDAIHRGRVYEYLVKPWKKEDLEPIIAAALNDFKRREAKLRELEEHAAMAGQLKEEIHRVYDFEGVLGESPGLRQILETLKKAAPTDSTILIQGETGTGKELLARAIHAFSHRKSRPFVPVHCAAIPQTLLEGELFGWEKGAFTGADYKRVGLFEASKAGTVFIDEIGEIPTEIQVKLLRVLQEKQVQRIGSNHPFPVDLRLVAATHQDLEQAIRDGRFREDFFYRLNVIRVTVPPLRERKSDIPILANYFLKKLNQQIGRDLTLSDKTLEYLSRYDWPGNIRELENILERAVILSVGSTIEPEDLNLDFEEMLKVEKVDLAQITSSRSVKLEVQKKEVESLKEALLKAKGNISETARLMGIARSTLCHRLRKYQLL